MTYRILLITSVLFMMFAVFGILMGVGAISGGSETAFGNFMFGGIMSVICIAFLFIGLRKMKSFTTLFEQAVVQDLQNNGCVEALHVATVLNISMDDSRDLIEKYAAKRSWKRIELDGYNARYYAA